MHHFLNQEAAMALMKALRSTDLDWAIQAACSDANPELFFPTGDSVIAELQAATALQICAICPVRPQCLQWALDHDQISGVWGGTTEAERPARRRLPRRPGDSRRLLCGSSSGGRLSQASALGR
jgi:WhiB family transcriptional regulator, redox-sensing transcriptional regulator